MVQYGSHFDHFGPPWSSQKLSGRPPKASLDLDRRPQPSPKRNPSLSYRKTTNQGNQKRYVGATNKPQPPPPVELFFDSAPYPSSVNAPTRRAPWVGGFRGPAATCADPGYRSQPNVFLPHNSKLLPNPKLQIKGPNSKLQTQMPNSQLKTQTEVLLFICSVIGCNNLLKNSSSGTEQQGLWLQSAYLSRSTRKQPILKRSLQSHNAPAPNVFSTKPRTGSK